MLDGIFDKLKKENQRDASDLPVHFQPNRTKTFYASSGLTLSEHLALTERVRENDTRMKDIQTISLDWDIEEDVFTSVSFSCGEKDYQFEVGEDSYQSMYMLLLECFSD